MGAISELFVVKFDEDVKAVYQQAGSRLRSYVELKSGFQGKSFSVNRMGVVEAATKDSRHEVHAHQNPDHSVRWGKMVYYYNSLMMDPDDDDRVLADPKNKYVMAAANALGRQTDRTILAAAVGTAETQEDHGGTAALPAGQIIAVGSGPMSIDKLTQTKRILDEAEVPDDGRVMAIAAQALEDLLGTTQVGSYDYNSVKSLVNGQLDTFMGFTFVRTQLCPKTSTTRSCVAFHKDAVVLGVTRDMYNRIAPRHDMHDAWETYAATDIGAVRRWDEGVVSVGYTES
jgi:hypothetical protein